MKKYLVIASVALAAFASSASAVVINVSHTWTDSDPSGTTRVFRDGVASLPASPKAFPGTQSNNPTYFFTYSFSVLPGSDVTVDFSADLSSFFALYGASFSSSNLAQNYLGDAGASSTLPASFGIVAPSNGLITFVGMSVGGNAALGHSFSANITYQPATGVPDGGMAGIEVALVGVWLTGAFMARRNRAKNAVA